MLDGEDIETYPLDVHMSALEGGIGVFPRRLMVRDEDFFAARVVMADNGIPTGE